MDAIRGLHHTGAMHQRPGSQAPRYVPLAGSFAHTGTVGGNTLRFRGRLRGRWLKPGRYRLRATPTDSAGNVGPVAATAFRIVR